MAKSSGGGGSGGRSGGSSGAGTDGDAGQPGEVVRAANNAPGADYARATAQIATLDAEIAKTNRAYEAATQAGDRDGRKMLRKLRSSLEDKKIEIEKARSGMKAVFKLPK
jgi:hypothetical protein